MNTEDNQNQHKVLSIGKRLCKAREQLGLSRQAVADRLCLKLSIIRDIEEDKSPSDLALIFFHGYIRSYAKLVHIHEVEVFPITRKQDTIRSSKVTPPIQSLSVDKKYKKNDDWITGFTFLIVIVLISLIGIWWWQNQKAQYEEITTMLDQSKKKLSDAGINPKNITKSSRTTEIVVETIKPSTFAENIKSLEKRIIVPTLQSSTNTTMIEKSLINSSISDKSNFLIDHAHIKKTVNNTDTLVIKFIADCWLEVIDATGKKLFSGLKNKDNNLNLTGHAPYQLRIGAPEAVQIQYLGKPIDLGHFFKKNHVAHLTLDDK